MNTLVRIGAVAALALTASAGIASARDNRLTDIDKRQEHQVHAIEAGRRDGSLTWYERLFLSREQLRIRELERGALADGKLDRREYQTIRQAQNDAGHHIYADRHNDRVRGWWWRLWN